MIKCISAFLLACSISTTWSQSAPATDFHREMAAKAATLEHAVVVGRDGWLFFAPELRHIGAGKFWGAEAASASRAQNSDDADPLPAILDFHRQLEKAGIELMLVPVPPKAFIYPEKISNFPATPRLDTHHRAFYRLLERAGIQVIDLAELFLSQKAEPLYCRHDTHWSGRACKIAAEHLGRLIKQKPWYAEMSRVSYAAQTQTIEITGDLWRMLQGEKPPKEKQSLRVIGAQTGGGMKPISPDKNSPILLIGDSHALVFHAGGDMHASGAGLADQLAYELGMPIDLLGVRGSGATPARISLYRRIRSDTGYLKQKKIVIWCFSAREFTESAGWRKVPVLSDR